MKKQKIRILDIPSLYLDTDLFCGTPEEIAGKVLDVPNQLHKAYLERAKQFRDWDYTPWELYEDIRIETGVSYSYGDTSIDVTVVVYREETDAECKARRKSEREYKAKVTATKEERERALLEELKKKYEQET